MFNSVISDLVTSIIHSVLSIEHLHHIIYLNKHDKSVMIWHLFCLFKVYLILLQVWSNQYWTLNLYIISYIWTRMAIIWHISLLNSGISDLITSMIKSVLSIETLHYIIYCCNIKYIKCIWFNQSNILYDFNICTNMANMLSPKTSNVFVYSEQCPMWF